MSTPLLWIKDYRPEWRSSYFLARPVTLASGTRLAMTTYFDTTDGQPSPSRAETRLLTAASAAASAPRDGQVARGYCGGRVSPGRGAANVNDTVDSLPPRWNCSHAL